jgi:hypothetical protein
MMIVGSCVFSMTFAMENVLPDPVTPSRTWLDTPRFMPSTSSLMACGWSPAGEYALFSLNFIP